MFLDNRFNCITLDHVKREIIGIQKFKQKYPGRNQYREKIITCDSRLNQIPSFATCNDLINGMVMEGKINERTGRFFDQSRQDRVIAAATIAFNCYLSSMDRDLVQFVFQEFDIQNKYPPPASVQPCSYRGMKSRIRGRWTGLEAIVMMLRIDKQGIGEKIYTLHFKNYL